MTNNRLEAFSDGVFAISITLLVLNIHIPGAEVKTNAQLLQALKEDWPNILTYVFSFLVIGVFWVAHQRIFSFIRQLNHFLLWANVFYLLTVAMMPFPAATLAMHPLFPSAIVLYCGVLFLCASQHFLLLYYIHRHAEYREPAYTAAEYRRHMAISTVGPACYLGGALFSGVSPLISFCFIVGALIFYIVVVAYLLPGKPAHR